MHDAATIAGEIASSPVLMRDASIARRSDARAKKSPA
jgi:hypothetical protein